MTSFWGGLQEGAQNARKKDKLDCVLYKGDHPFEPLFEDFAYGILLVLFIYKY